ncbi:MAG: hypothetical protein M1376_11545 [Planctomycetes bacterium]|nr:hypothetical protein [Planctomycetota bacterium]
MVNIKLHRDQAKPLTKILCALAVLLGALILLKIAGFFASTSQARVLEGQADAARAGVNDLKKLLAETKTTAEELKKKNLFVQATPKQFPVRDVLGIMGHEALINDKWYKVGDSVAEARITAIEPTKVKIVWNGQEKEFTPITSGGAAGGRPDQAGSPSGGPGPGGPRKMVAAGGRREPGNAPASGLSADEMTRMRAQWKNATTPEEKQRLREAMRQRAGRRS